MQERPESNIEIEETEIFKVLNPYFILLFSVCCIISSVFIQQLFYMAGQFRYGILVAPVMGIVLPVFLLTRRFSGGFMHQLRIRLPDRSVTFHVFVATLAMIAVVDHLYLFSQRLLPAPFDYLETLKELRPDGPWSAIVTFVGLGVAVPIAEEIIFRGIIQRVFQRNMGGVVAIILAGVFFGVIHLNPQLLLSMACFGLFLGFIFYVTENLTYPILSHGIVNSVAFLQLTSTKDGDFSRAPFYLQHPSIFVLALAAVLILAWRIKKGARANGAPESETGRPL